ncbi:hypothetical protein AZI86_03445 [Bdellovibrio bacteriovorus]|uniref:Uncharacterized protein n=2 Tax=Bdellovibrio bacteriovorus TaxID=959 RepID=A0A150WPA4_BDEBC|nr:hypothetical protein AZI86_03445 [Bdellovibrio bacteriovorus]
MAGLSLFAFQNCGGGFEAIPGTTLSSSLGNSDLSNETSNPSPAPVRTTFFFGRSAGIDGIELNSQTSQVTELGSSVFQGSHVGWFGFDESTKTLLAAEEGTSRRLQTYTYNTNSQTLTSRDLFAIAASTVHLTLLKTVQEVFLFGSSYDQGRLDSYKLNNDLTTIENAQNISFGSSAKAHSSAFDPRRNLLFVATLGLNRISIYRFDRINGLTAAGQVTVNAPRTVVYDSTYDKLYVATEASSGNSAIYAYAIIENNGSYSLSNVGSVSMPLRGADLKVNHAFGYVMATARQSGQEAIWGMPVTEQGVQDHLRPNFSIPISQVEPRSLELSADGRFAIVAMNSSGSANVLVYALNFTNDKSFLSSQIIWSKRFGNYGIVSSIAIPANQ